MAWVTPTAVVTGDLITAAQWNQDVVNNTIALLPSGCTVLIDGGGAVISSGVKAFVEVPFKCDIDRVTLVADQSGTIQVDINKATYSGIPTYTSITASATPALSSAQKYQDSTLTGWTTALAAGDWLEIEVDASPAPASVTLVALAIKVTRS